MSMLNPRLVYSTLGELNLDAIMSQVSMKACVVISRGTLFVTFNEVIHVDFSGAPHITTLLVVVELILQSDRWWLSELQPGHYI